MDAILLAAGRSTRMGPGLEKQLYRIGGTPMMIFALERILDHPSIDRVIITCPIGRQDEVEAIVKEYSIGLCQFIEGGQTRQESVYMALAQVKTDHVLIHEAARPLVKPELIDRVASHQGEDAVVPTTPVPFTTAIGDDYMEQELDRDRLRNVQLPQMFRTQSLREAHEAARKQGAVATEDSMLLFRAGRRVKFVEGDVENIKVTWPVELLVVKSLLFFDRELT